MYTIGVLLFPAYKQWPNLATRLKWAGLPTMATALIAGSFANKVSHLVLSQGVLYAIGGSIVYYPTLAFLDEWFIQRKGLAYGIMWVRTTISTYRKGAPSDTPKGRYWHSRT